MSNAGAADDAAPGTGAGTDPEGQACVMEGFAPVVKGGVGFVVPDHPLYGFWCVVELIDVGQGHVCPCHGSVLGINHMIDELLDEGAPD